MLGLEPAQLRVVCPWVGGGFGPKAAPVRRAPRAAAAALKLGRPVKWIATRSEDMVSLVQGRDFVMTAKLGVNDDGKIVGLDASVVASAGAYPALGAILPMLTQMMSVGVYDIPKVRFKATGVLTNNTTIGAYRGAGRPEATQLIERVIDVAADKIGMDPAEIRRGNFIPPDQFPLTTTTGANYDSGEYEKALDAVLDGIRLRRAAGRAGRAPRQRRRQAARDRRVDLRGGHRAGRAAHRVRRGRDPRRRHRQRVRRAPACTARAITPPSPCWPARCSASRWTRSRSSTPTPTACRAVPARWARVRCRPPAAPSTSRRTRCSTGPARSPATCSRHRPTTSSSATAACTWPACRPRSLSWGELAVASRDASKLPDGLEPAPLRHELDFDGTDSTYPVRRARLGRRGRHRDRPGHDAAPRRRRRLRSHPQPAARRRPAARRHRPGRGAGARTSGCSTTTTATRSPPT